MKKITKYFIIILCLLVICIASYSCIRISSKKEVNEMQEQITSIKNHLFKINKIVAYSSANAENIASNQKAYWDLNIWQFTDFAIYIQINNNSQIVDSRIKGISIENLKVIEEPELGETKFYERKLKDIAKSDIPEIETSEIKFEVIDNENDLNEDKLQFLSNGKYPLTFRYVNSKIGKNNLIKNTNEKLEYNAKVLKRANITLDSIKSKISFTVKIINGIDENYICDVSLNLPISEEIYSGSEKVSIDEKSQLFHLQ